MKAETTAPTLVGLLRDRAARRPADVAFGFLPDGEGDLAAITYAGLDAEARRIAAQIAELLAPGSRALVVYEPGLDFIAAFFGCLYAGVVAVPAYPPMPGQPTPGLDSLRLIIRDCAAQAVLTHDGLRGYIRGIDVDATLAGVRWIVTGHEDGDAAAWRDPRSSADTIAMLQYTSGSTANPRGVVLRHRNLLANQRAIQAAHGGSDSVIMSWLPPYHDMGLIGFLLHPLYLGSPCYLMSPLHFLQKPVRWLRAIQRFHVTLSGGPPFAYDLCTRRVTAQEKASLDLSSWEVAFIGAEPIRSEGIDRFAAAFAPCGFRETSLYPCYGLAEATLLVTGATRGAGAVRLEVDPATLGDGAAATAGEPGQGPKRLVSSGRAPAGHEIAIVDPATGKRLGERVAGEVWVAAESVADGYWNRATETAATFGSHLPELPGRRFLRTGDLGFLAGGELFITGRIKELLIVRGRNILPQDVETAGQAVDGRLRPGCGAAFALDGGDGERVALVQETKINDAEAAAALLPQIRQAVLNRLGVRLSQIVLVSAKAVPKTSSGKVRRLRTRDLLRAGQLPVIAAFDEQERDHDGR